MYEKAIISEFGLYFICIKFQRQKVRTKQTEKDSNNRPITFSVRFHPYASLNKHWQLIEQDATLSKIFTTKIAMALKKEKQSVIKLPAIKSK